MKRIATTNALGSLQDDDSVLDLQMISIRLQKGLIVDLKQISRLRGLNYQPLIRQVLQRAGLAWDNPDKTYNLSVI